jgi:hypothetical protein
MPGAEEPLNTNQKVPAGRGAMSAGGFGVAWPNPARDEGDKGSLTKPRRDTSRLTALRVNGGLQRMAHLDFVPLSLLGRIV